MGGSAQDDRPEGLSGAAASRLVKRSVVVSGHRTSISLELAFWRALQQIARTQGRSINQVVGEIDRKRHGNLSSAVRVYVLATLKAHFDDRPQAFARRSGASDNC